MIALSSFLVGVILGVLGTLTVKLEIVTHKETEND